MTSWLLSIVGVVFVGVMVDIISPSGKTNAFIKSIFAIFLIYVVISPLIKLVKKDAFEITQSYNFSSVETDPKIVQAEHQITEGLISNGICGIDVEIIGYVSNNGIVAQKVILNGAKTVLNSMDEHIDKYKLITEIVQSVITVKKENIVYG